VAERLQVTKPFIYSYYRNKGEILSEICQYGHQPSRSTPCTKRWRAAAVRANACAWWSIGVARIVLEQSGNTSSSTSAKKKNLEPADARRILREQRLRFDRELSQLLEEGQSRGEFAIDDIPLTATTIGGMLSGEFPALAGRQAPRERDHQPHHPLRGQDRGTREVPRMSTVNTTSDPRIPAADRCAAAPYLLDRLAGRARSGYLRGVRKWRALSSRRDTQPRDRRGRLASHDWARSKASMWPCGYRTAGEGLLDLLAINYLGAVFAPFNTAYKGRILEHVIDNSDARVIVAHAQLAPLLDEVSPAQLRTAGAWVGEGAAPSTLASVAFPSLSEGDSTLPELKRPIQPWDTQLDHLHLRAPPGPRKACSPPTLHIFTNAGPSTWHFVTGGDRFLV
jgi:AcrR family transcriptional regulator